MILWVQFVKKVNRKDRKGVQYLLFGVRRLIMKAFRWFLVGKLRNLSRERFKTDSGINPVMHFLGQTCTKRHKTPFVSCTNQVSSIRSSEVSYRAQHFSNSPTGVSLSSFFCTAAIRAACCFCSRALKFSCSRNFGKCRDRFPSDARRWCEVVGLV